MNNGLTQTIKVKQFQTITWPEQFVAENEETGEKEIRTRQIILLYGLGEDGIIYECSGGDWMPLPISPGNMRERQKKGPAPIVRKRV